MTAGSPTGLLLILTYATGGGPTPPTPGELMWTKEQKVSTDWTKE